MFGKFTYCCRTVAITKACRDKEDMDIIPSINSLCTCKERRFNHACKKNTHNYSA
nr:MAG TPA: hypothetical protein [Herelleviridae sp.]